MKHTAMQSKKGKWTMHKEFHEENRRCWNAAPVAHNSVQCRSTPLIMAVTSEVERGTFANKTHREGKPGEAANGSKSSQVSFRRMQIETGGILAQLLEAATWLSNLSPG